MQTCFCVWCGDEVDGKMDHSKCVAPILGIAKDLSHEAREAEDLALNARAEEAHLRQVAESLQGVASRVTVP